MGKILRPVLSIAGSDPSGGAGIQADIKTMAALGVYACAVPTALTVQNTLGVKEVFSIPGDFFQRQLEAVLEDIRPEATKIGMVGSGELIRELVAVIKKYKLKNIVLDPVMVSTSGKDLLDRKDLRDLEDLLSLSTLITPNILEAQVLLDIEIKNLKDMIEASQRLGEKYGTSVLIKGGHKEGSADDVLFTGGRTRVFSTQRLANPNTHGTGCTLSSALASYLALAYPMDLAVEKSKKYLTGAIKADLDLGKGPGPLNHMWQYYKGEDNEKL